jgi:hypothetical protein
MLSLGAYRKLKIDTRTGFSADFKLRHPEKGVIYQKVNLHYTTDVKDDKPAKWSFTEAWVVNPKRRRKIEQDGTDAFLVDTDDVAEHGGKIRFKTVAWFEAGAIDSSFKRDKDGDPWGTLKGKTGQRAVPVGARVVKRTVVAKWKKGGKITWDK